MNRYTLRGRGDDGIALVVSVSLMGLVTTLVLAMFAYALRETSASGFDRQRASAVTAAEGQLDLTLARIQNADPTTIPCGAQPVATSQQSAADRIGVTTSVTYFDAAGAAVPCSALATTPLVQAKIVSAAASDPLAGRAPAMRTVESLVQLTAKPSNSLDKAIYGAQGVTMDNSFELNGSGGVPNADVYSNGNVVCKNSGTYNGSVFSLAGIRLVNSCRVDVDAHATTGFHAQNSNSVGGKVLVHAGNAVLENSASVGQQVRTSGSINWSECRATKCFPNTQVPPVPTTPFPVIKWDAAAEAQWRAAGYNRIVTDKNNCSDQNAADNPARWIRENAPLVSLGKTVVVTTCTVHYRNSNTVKLANDMAVFAYGGFKFENSLELTSTNSTVRSLHLIQPYDAVSTHPCLTVGIDIGNSVKVEPTVSEFMYSPCSITKRNSADYFGQIYSGGVATFENSFKMQFRPVPTFGVTGGSSATAESYSLSLQYKRETR